MAIRSLVSIAAEARGEDFASWVHREPDDELQTLVLAAAAGTLRR